MSSEQEHRDALPADLDPTGYVGPYVFPNIKRRRISGFIYLGSGIPCILLWILSGEGVYVNGGMLVGGIALVLLGAYHFAAAYNLSISQNDALVEATRRVGFAVGHASAQLSWRGLRSRPTWRVLLYSADDPPSKRGLVLVDGVEGAGLEFFVEENPEDWSVYQGSGASNALVAPVSD